MLRPGKRKLDRNTNYQPQTRQIICKMYDFMKREAVVKFADNITDARWRTAKAVGTSPSTISKFLKERREMNQDGSGSLSPDDEPSASGSKRKKSGKAKSDTYDIGVVRKRIHEFHKQRQCPNIETIKITMSGLVGFEGCDETLLRYLNKLGFCFQKTDYDRKALMEDHRIQLARLQYLNQVQAYRKAGKCIVYTGETCIHTNDVEKDCVAGLTLKVDEGERIIVMHAGSANTDHGFLPDVAMTFKSDTSVSNFHKSITELHYLTWLEFKLIPKLPQGAVVVIDDVPYHNAEVNKVPLSYCSKKDLRDWLTANSIPFKPYDTNAELYELVKKNRKAYRRFKADELLEKHGFTVIRLPPLHPELNALESIWQLVKTYVSFRNVEQTYESVMHLMRESFVENNKDVWTRVCKNVEETENQYLEYSSMDFSFMKNGNMIADPGDLSSEGDSDSE